MSKKRKLFAVLTAIVLCASMPGTTLAQGILELGDGAEANGDHSIALGYYAIANGDFGRAYGENTLAEGHFSSILGADNQTFGDFSFANGLTSLTGNPGMNPEESGFFSFTFGEEITNYGNRSFAFGKGIVIGDEASYGYEDGYFSFAFGEEVKNYGNRSFAFGKDVIIDSKVENSYVFGTGGGVGSELVNDIPNTFMVGFEGNPLFIVDGNEHSISVDGDIYAATARVTGFRMSTGASNGYVLTSNASGYASWQPLANDGDWAIVDVNMYAVVSGNVGIGTTSPLHALHISKDYSDDTGADGNFIDIQNSNLNTEVMSGIRFWNGVTNNTIKGAIFYQDKLSNGRGDMIFANNSVDAAANVTAADAKMIIKNNGNIGIGTTNPTEKLEVNGTIQTDGFKLPTGAINEYVLTSDASGNATWQALSSDGDWTISGSNMYSAVSGNVGIGTTSPNAKLNVEDGSVLFNGSIGTTPVSGVGTRMMWIPYKGAFRSGHVTGNYWDDSNIGYWSFATGWDTKASGWGSIAFGESTNAGGWGSTAFGVGTYASGWYSTAFGISTTAQAYSSLAIGRYNVVTGTTDNWVETDPLFVIGNGSNSSNRANALTVLKNGNLGIGTTNPTEKLEVDGTIQTDSLKLPTGAVNGHVLTSDASGNATWQALSSDGDWTISGSNMYSAVSGNVGIGETNPSYKLYVNGDIYCTGDYLSSDKRFKKEIKTINNALDKVRSLRGTSYEFRTTEFKNKKFTDGNQYGFIAQELKKVLPELVKQDENGYYAVNYDGVIPVLTEAIKEQQGIIEYQQDMIEQLNEEMTELRQLVSFNSKQNNSGGVFDNEKAKLYQNNPNPFNQQTEINYYLADNVNSAAMLIFDMNGKQLKRYDLTTRGNDKVIIHGNEFTPGMYMYSLVANGKLVDTKTMVLTK